MCIRSYSESGQPGGFVPCNSYERLRFAAQELLDLCVKDLGLTPGPYDPIGRIKKELEARHG